MQFLNNKYQGVNPHLNSLLQTPEGEGKSLLFSTFHAAFIAQIVIHLNQHLPENYIAVAEESLQLLNLAELMKGVHIYQIEQSQLGRVVNYIEVLSPDNKPGGSHFFFYRLKRVEFSDTNISLVEIDLLHESRPIDPRLLAYPQKGAYAYHIFMSYSRPLYRRKEIYGFNVDQPLPNLVLPLTDYEAVSIDFDTIYQQTFKQNRFYKFVDYSTLPPRFDSYRKYDQAAIVQRMKYVASL